MILNYHSTIFLLNGPSGSGKTTLIKSIQKKFRNFYVPVTCTTRKMRNNEKNGVDYFFLSKEKFESYIENNDLIEYVKNFGEYYGILKSEIDLTKHTNIILSMTTDGIKAMKKIYLHNVVSILLVTNTDTLKKRLMTRKEHAQINIRMQDSQFSQDISIYDYVISTNQPLFKSVNDLLSILRAEHLKNHLQDL